MTIKRVAICGGVHGNELTGIHLIDRWREDPDEINRRSFKPDLFLGNPKAVKSNVRFIDEDLNRCFSTEALLRLDSTSYEVARAVQLNATLGPKGSSRYDFIIDLHTSTANCGAMIILVNDNEFNIRLASYIQQKVSSARIFHIPGNEGDSPYLGSICPRNFAVEVGPIPQGCLRYDIFSLANEITKHALDFAQGYNDGEVFELPHELELFRFREVVKFPRTGSRIDGMVHEAIQGQDYKKLSPGDPMFRKFNGDEILFSGDKPAYPVFINEAAYYYQGIAMSLTDKVRVKVG